VTPFRLLFTLLSAAALVAGPANASLWALSTGEARTTAPPSLDDHPRAARLVYDQDSRQGPEQTERFTQTYKVGADGALDLQNIAGDVRVTTTRGNEIVIEAIKRIRHRDTEEGKRLLGQLRIEATQVGNRVEVRTIYPRVSGRGLSAGVDYTVTVPLNTIVSVKTISGDVAVTGVRGEVRAETVSGNVQVTSTPNLAMAKTVSGDVTARDISAAVTLTLGTVSGSVIATGLKVRALEAGTVSGNVHLSSLQVERLSAKSVSGDIEFEGPLARGGRYEFNSHSGNVRVILTNVPGFELDASTFSGSIRSDFPVTLRSSPDRDTGNDRRRGGMNRAIRGTYGDASAIIAVRSFSGSVVITKK
jgi:DUF4097 and DUF4098 domain-containing protein YvlB